MTLYRQMLIFTSVLFGILFAAAFLIKLESTRTFLQEQLESHAQDTATSLGLSILPAISNKDLATVDTMMNAVFDRGYYRKIVLTDLHDKVLIERQQEVVIDEVPAWFIRAIPLTTPTAETLITSGWQQMGHLHVESHPGYAYKTLWRAGIDMGRVFAAIAVLALTAGALILRLLLRPLRQVELQAEDLCRRQYSFQMNLPKTRELRRVVVAMNSMTRKIKEMFDEQAQVAEQLRKNSFSDILTGLGNRRYLEGQVSAGMEQRDTAVGGVFLLLQVNNLVELNQKKGYLYSDQLLQKITTCLRQATQQHANAALARISGGSFAVFLPDATLDEGQRIAVEITGKFGELQDPDNNSLEDLAHIGGISYDRPTSLGHLLAAADRLLSAAENQGPNSWALATLAAEPFDTPKGEQEWLKILDDVLKRKDIAIFCQAVGMCGRLQNILHLELFARIFLEDGRMLNAGIFIPLAERLGRIAAIDKLVLEKALRLETRDILCSELAVNISPASLRDSAFTSWIYAQLKNRRGETAKIIFEFSECNAIREMILLQQFAGEVKKLGHFIGLDHFGQSFANFGYLKSLQPKYVKIDRAFTDELKSKESDTSFFISSLASVAHSLDILLIAEGIEHEQQYQTVTELKIDGVQGYFIDQPRQLPEVRR